MLKKKPKNNNFFIFFIDDIKSDIAAIKEIMKRTKEGKPIFSEKVKEEFNEWKKNYSIYQFLSDNWLFFLLLALAFISGWWIASQYYQGVCNNYIIDNFLKENISSKMQTDFIFNTSI